ncbi:MAG: hypothetical protein HRT45_08910 [Bdellovibrionales bacterium]|nr:hypothetical protein [Bdellovibrionales bacterium]
MTFITRLEKTKVINGTSQKFSKFASVTAYIRVANSKTESAYIANHYIHPNSVKIGPELPFGFLAETNITGDQRLLTGRIAGKKINFQVRNAKGQLRNKSTRTNIFYATYPTSHRQCDVTKWTWDRFFPISHAHYEDGIKQRYKLARYPLRDGIGNIIPDGNELGGSYPWMDEDAANLFFFANGRDNFYNDNNPTYPEADASSDYDKPGVDGVTARQIEDTDARTVGLSIAGL